MLEMKTVTTSAKLRRQSEGGKEGEGKRAAILAFTFNTSTKHYKTTTNKKKSPIVHRHTVTFHILHNAKLT